jgi:hypothetical protein
MGEREKDNMDGRQITTSDIKIIRKRIHEVHLCDKPLVLGYVERVGWRRWRAVAGIGEWDMGERASKRLAVRVLLDWFNDGE